MYIKGKTITGRETAEADGRQSINQQPAKRFNHGRNMIEAVLIKTGLNHHKGIREAVPLKASIVIISHASLAINEAATLTVKTFLTGDHAKVQVGEAQVAWAAGDEGNKKR